MTTRKAKRKPASRPAVKRSTPRTSATRARAPKAAHTPAEASEVKPAGVEIDGATTVRHYGDGTSSTLHHVSPEAAQEYAASCKGGA